MRGKLKRCYGSFRSTFFIVVVCDKDAAVLSTRKVGAEIPVPNRINLALLDLLAVLVLFSKG